MCGDALKSKGYTIHGFTLGNRWHEFWNNDFKIHSLTPNKEAYNIELELERLQKDYPLDRIASFPQADRFICNLPRKRQRLILVHTFKCVERIIKEGVHAFITTGTAYLYNLVILAVSRKFKIPAISIYNARQSDSRFTYSLGNGGTWDAVTREYQSLAQKETDLSEEINFITSFREKFKAPDYMSSIRQEGNIHPMFIREFITRCKRWYIGNWHHRDDYLTQHPIWYAHRDIKRTILKRILSKVFDFDKPNTNDKYYIYPLHLQPEASTLILGDDYVDQINTIKSIARRLPADTWLYVKEHPAAFGRHTLKFYSSLKCIHNVKIIAPREDNHLLISKAIGVIVISGTMGWEALLLGTQSIVLGSVFYDGFCGITKITNINELTAILNKNEHTSATISDAAKALKAVKSKSYAGYFDVAKLDTRDKVLSKKNISLFTAGIEEILNHLHISQGATISKIAS